MTELLIANNLKGQWAAHTKEWSICARCKLCEDATTHVLARGSIPADILFIGEAPGHSEDSLGFPFIGPSGKLLDKLIARAIQPEPSSTRYPFKFCISNIVACIPLDADKDGGVRPPTEEEALACSDRLDDLLKMVQPKGIVLLGKTAQNLMFNQAPESFQRLELYHPAYLLRKGGDSHRNLDYKRTYLSLRRFVRQTCSKEGAKR